MASCNTHIYELYKNLLDFATVCRIIELQSEKGEKIMADKAIHVGRKRKFGRGASKWEGLVEKNLVTFGRPSRDRIFASNAGLCARQTAGLMMLPSSFKSRRLASTQFYFKIGSAFEAVMEKAFKRGGVFIDSEFRVECYHPDIPVSGRIDFVLRDPDTGEVLPMELKSCGKLPSNPKHHHLAQLMVYLAITGKPRGLLWYVSRTVSDFSGALKQMVFEVEPTEKEKYQTVLRMAYATRMAEHNFLPAIPKDMKKYKCGFCPLVPMCWQDEDLGLRPDKPSGPELTSIYKMAKYTADEVMENQKWLAKEFDLVFIEKD